MNLRYAVASPATFLQRCKISSRSKEYCERVLGDVALPKKNHTIGESARRRKLTWVLHEVPKFVLISMESVSRTRRLERAGKMMPCKEKDTEVRPRIKKNSPPRAKPQGAPSYLRLDPLAKVLSPVTQYKHRERLGREETPIRRQGACGQHGAAPAVQPSRCRKGSAVEAVIFLHRFCGARALVYGARTDAASILRCMFITVLGSSGVVVTALLSL